MTCVVILISQSLDLILISSTIDTDNTCFTVCTLPCFFEYFSCNQGDMNKLHRDEMLKAATEARDRYLREHPEARDINLKYDPLKHIQECKYCYMTRLTLTF